MPHRFRSATVLAPFGADDLDLATTTASPEGCETPEAIAGLVADLTVGTPLAEELQLAVVDGEAPDGVRFALALLGALAFAARAGCRPVQVRRFADALVRTTLDGVRAPETVELCAGRAVRVVDTLYLLHGARAFAGDAKMLLDVALMLEGDESVN
ncbi:MAG: hypothetical protein ACXW61_13825 [Gemmatirosa sp.]